MLTSYHSFGALTKEEGNIEHAMAAKRTLPVDYDHRVLTGPRTVEKILHSEVTVTKRSGLRVSVLLERWYR
jgi:hypothetical protein